MTRKELEELAAAWVKSFDEAEEKWNLRNEANEAATSATAHEIKTREALKSATKDKVIQVIELADWYVICHKNYGLDRVPKEPTGTI